MSRMSANFLAAVRVVKDPPLIPVVTFYWQPQAIAMPATQYYSSQPFQYFKPRIIEAGIGDITSIVSERPSDVTFQTCQVSLSDHDGVISAILCGAYEQRRARVCIRWAHPGLAEADWFTLFDGIVHDWQWQRGVATVNCKTDDVALYGNAPKVPLMTGSIPGLVNAARGLYAPIIYGIHDDQNLDAKGAIPCPNVILDATNGYWYLVGIGALKSVPRVYLNDTLKTVSTHYTVEYPKWGGTTFTAIKFVSATVATDVVAADVEGLTDVGTGGGGLILSAASQLKHFLVNFGWGDWRTGAWLSESTAPIDTVAFTSAESFIGKFGSEGSLYVGGTTDQERVLDVVNRWLKSQPMLRPRWSNDGKFGLRPLDHASGAYLASPWVQQERDELTPLQYEAEAGQLVSRLSLSYLPGMRAGKLWQSLDLQDLALWQTEKVTEHLSFECSAARFQ